jgi:phasin family protein
VFGVELRTNGAAEEAVEMAKGKKMAERANRIGEGYKKPTDRVAGEFQEQPRRAGEESQTAAASGSEAASGSAAEISRGFQSIAAELTDYSKKTLEDLFQTWEQLLRARTATEVIEVQTRYAQKAYETHLAKMSKLAELYADLTRKASKPD